MQELDQVPKELIAELHSVFYPGPHIIDNALEVIGAFMENKIWDPNKKCYFPNVDLYDSIMLTDYKKTLDENWLENLVRQYSADSSLDVKDLPQPIMSGNIIEDARRNEEFTKKRIDFYRIRFAAIKSDYNMMVTRITESGTGPLGRFCQDCLNFCETDYKSRYEKYQTIAANRMLAMILKSIIAGLYAISKCKNDIVELLYPKKEGFDSEQSDKLAGRSSSRDSLKSNSFPEGLPPSPKSGSAIVLKSQNRESLRGESIQSSTLSPPSPKTGSTIAVKPQNRESLRGESIQSSTLSPPSPKTGSDISFSRPPLLRNDSYSSTVPRSRSNATLEEKHDSATSVSSQLATHSPSKPIRPPEVPILPTSSTPRKNTNSALAIHTPVERTLSSSSLRGGVTPRFHDLLRGKIPFGSPRGSLIIPAAEVSGEAKSTFKNRLETIINSKFFTILEQDATKNFPGNDDSKTSNGFLSNIFSRKLKDDSKIKDNESEAPVDINEVLSPAFWEAEENFCVTLDRLIAKMSQLQNDPKTIDDASKTELISSLIDRLNVLKTWIASKSLIVLKVYAELDSPTQRSESPEPVEVVPIISSVSQVTPAMPPLDPRPITPVAVPSAASSSSLPEMMKRDSNSKATSDISTAATSAPAPVQNSEPKKGSKISATTASLQPSTPTNDPAPPKILPSAAAPAPPAGNPPRPKNGSRIGASSTMTPPTPESTSSESKSKEVKADEDKNHKKKSSEGKSGWAPLNAFTSFFSRDNNNKDKESKDKESKDTIDGKKPNKRASANMKTPPLPATSSDSSVVNVGNRNLAARIQGRASFGSSAELTGKNNDSNSDRDGIFQMDSTAPSAP